MKKIIFLLLVLPLFYISQNIKNNSDSMVELEYLELELIEPLKLIEPIKLEIQKRNKRRKKDSLVKLSYIESGIIEPVKILELEIIEKEFKMLKCKPIKLNKIIEFDSTVIEVLQFEPIPYYEVVKSDSLNEPLLLKFIPKFKKKYNSPDTLIELKPVELIEPIEAIEIPVFIKIKHQK